MSKKLFCLLPVIILITLTFGGCKGVRDYVEPDQQYLISAIGFDSENGKIKMSAEAIAVRQEDRESGIESVIFTGYGKTVNDAFIEIYSYIANNPVFSHCGVFILGDSLNEEQLENIFGFVYDESEISFDAYIIASDDAEKLLKAKPISSPVLGYDLMGLIKQRTDSWKLKYTSRIYETGKRRKLTADCFTVPYIVKDKSELSVITGLKTYRNEKGVAVIDNDEGFLLTLIKNSYGGGKVSFEEDGKTYDAEIMSSDTDIKAKFGERLMIEINENIRVKKGSLSHPVNEFSSALAKITRDFTEKYQKNGNDIFAFDNVLKYRYSGIFKTVEKDYPSAFKNADIKVNCYIKEGRG